MHHIKLFARGGSIAYIHHDTDDPSNDEPGDQLRKPHGEKVRFKSRDGGFTIEFKTESPFVSGAGKPGSPIVSLDGSLTPAEKLKTIISIRRTFAYTATLAGITDDPEIIIDDGGGGVAKKKGKKGKKGKKK